MGATFNRKPAVRVRGKVRITFPPTKRGEPIEYREGVVEHIRDDDTALVRITAGWLHAERVSRLQVLA